MIDLDFRLQDDLGSSGANSSYRWKGVSRIISSVAPVYFAGAFFLAVRLNFLGYNGHVKYYSIRRSCWFDTIGLTSRGSHIQVSFVEARLENVVRQAIVRQTLSRIEVLQGDCISVVWSTR